MSGPAMNRPGMNSPGMNSPGMNRRLVRLLLAGTRGTGGPGTAPRSSG